MRLTAAAILAADDLKREDVDCPEWGGTVTVRELTAGDRQRFRALSVAGDADGVLSAALVAMSAIDEDGQLLFATADLAALAGKNPAPIERLAKASLILSGLYEEPEQAEKN